MNLNRLKSVPVLLGLVAAFTHCRGDDNGATNNGPESYFPLHTRCTGLLLGAALAFAPPLPRLGWTPIVALACLAGLLMTDGSGPYAALIWRVPAVEIVTAVLIAALAAPSRLTSALSWGPLTRIGTPVHIRESLPEDKEYGSQVMKLDQSKDPDPPRSFMLSDAWFKDPPGPLLVD